MALSRELSPSTSEVNSVVNAGVLIKPAQHGLLLEAATTGRHPLRGSPNGTVLILLDGTSDLVSPLLVELQHGAKADLRDQVAVHRRAKGGAVSRATSRARLGSQWLVLREIVVMREPEVRTIAK